VEALLGAQQRGGRGPRRDEAVRRHEARGSRGGRGRARLGRREEEAEEAVGDWARRGRGVPGGPGVAGHGRAAGEEGVGGEWTGPAWGKERPF